MLTRPLLQKSFFRTLLRMGTTTSKSPAFDFVQESVNSDCVVVFSKTTCGFCRMAKDVLNNAGAVYTVIEVNQRQDGYQIQEALQQLTGASTVPRVFINGKCIGGGTETKQLHQEGKLLPLLNQCTKEG